MHVIVVEFEIEPEHIQAFVAEAIRHATDTKEREPGCVQFDVCADTAATNVFYFYEVYADDDALDAHGHSTSLAQYRETTKDWIIRRTVKRALKRN